MQPSDESRIEVVVTGYVQGVGYRFYTQRQASALGLRGYVRNRPDERVEVVAEGPRASLERLIEALRRGPSDADVQDVTVRWQPPQHEFTRFTIRH
jgi:acylphosphatase